MIEKLPYLLAGITLVWIFGRRFDPYIYAFLRRLPGLSSVLTEDRRQKSERRGPDRRKTRDIGARIVGALFIGSAAFVLLSDWYGPQEKRWAYMVIGAMVGYWLR